MMLLAAAVGLPLEKDFGVDDNILLTLGFKLAYYCMYLYNNKIELQGDSTPFMGQP